jgi:gliding motility-associated-like protein
MMVHRMRFYIPNAVTINNDGVNESFFIPGSEFMRTYHIEIYNRWGERVFESNNPNETFTPEYKGSDVYIYKLNIFDIYNERHLINGVFGVYR